MDIPLPRVIPDATPGGYITAGLEAINALSNNRALRKYNEIKADYAPLSIASQAASQMAYANLMAPQFIAKAMNNPQFMANLSEGQKNMLRDMVYKAGTTNPTNSLAQIQSLPTGVGQPSTNSFSGKIKELLSNAFNKKPMELELTYPQSKAKTNDGINHDLDARFIDYMNSPEGQQEGASLPSEAQLMGDHTPTWAENTGRFQGTMKQGEEEGKYRAEALKRIGESQLGLSNSGAVLDRMTKIVKNPIFQNMRSKIPYFQDKQLSYLMKNGTPEEKRLIGDFLTTAESFIASTVQGFSGKPLVREFDLAQRQKITPSDPVHVAEGKLQAAIALHDIAEKKNDIISDLLSKGMNEAEAVKQANKMVDVSEIERKTEELLRDKPTEEDIKYMAKKHNKSPAMIIKLLKAKGVY